MGVSVGEPGDSESEGREDGGEREEPPRRPLLKLTVDQEVADATTPVRWCNTPELLQEVAAYNGRAHVLLIVVAPQEWESERYLVPLTQMMQYVAFRRPGKNRIFATVVYDAMEIGYRKLRNHYLTRDESGNFHLNVLKYDKSGFFRESYQNNAAEVEVDVPDGLFDKERPAWLVRWVNLWWGKHRDSCDFRRRMIPTIMVQPIVLLIAFFFLVSVRTVISLFLFLCGMRGINFAPIIHPWRDGTAEVYDDLRGSIFYRRWRGRHGEPRKTGVFLPTTPIVWVTLFGLLLGGSWLFPNNVLVHNVQESAIAAALVVLLVQVVFVAVWVVVNSFLLVVAAIMGTCELGLGILSKLRRFFPERPEVKPESSQERRRRFLQPLLCDAVGRPDLQSLPPSHRTFRLRMQKVKARVCRPARA